MAGAPHQNTDGEIGGVGILTIKRAVFALKVEPATLADGSTDRRPLVFKTAALE
jgi:hypothetical protein